jgi:hypothetical protein
MKPSLSEMRRLIRNAGIVLDSPERDRSVESVFWNLSNDLANGSIKWAERNGETRAHNRTWPMYHRDAYNVEVVGSIEAHSAESAEQLRSELEEVLGRHGVTVRVYPVGVFFMSPADQAEKNALDEKAIAA